MSQALSPSTTSCRCCAIGNASVPRTMLNPEQVRVLRASARPRTRAKKGHKRDKLWRLRPTATHLCPTCNTLSNLKPARRRGVTATSCRHRATRNLGTAFACFIIYFPNCKSLEVVHDVDTRLIFSMMAFQFFTIIKTRSLPELIRAGKSFWSNPRCRSLISSRA